ncbi:hypothetical protein KR032_009324, partial [Drosophila birchii]
FKRFTLLALQVAWAMMSFRGHCPQNMTAMKGLEMNKFMGKWYTHAKYTTKLDKIYRCESVEFKQDNNTKYYIETRMLSRQTDTVILKKAEILKLEPEAGRYVQNADHKVFPNGIQIYVLDTDYDNYAIRFMCFDTNGLYSFHWAALQFRKRLPDPKVLHEAQKIASENGIRLFKLYKIPQNGCPPDT